MTTITPREYVGRALNLLETAAAEVPLYASAITPIDVAGVLRAMLDSQEQLFPNEFKRREARTYIHELIVTRNKWAHSEPLSNEDALRAADTVGRILGLLGQPTSAVDGLKQELRPQTTLHPPALIVPTPSHTAVSTIAVVACGKRKQTKAATAAELYTGPLVRRSVEAARSANLPIFVLSTKYGLVSGDTVIEPYELGLEGMSKADYMAWQAKVHATVAQLCEQGLQYVIAFASRAYREAFLAATQGLPLTVETHAGWDDICRESFK